MTLPFDNVIRTSTWMTKKFHLMKKVSSAVNRKVLRGQVYWCEFGENIGSEQSEKRPALILSNNPANKTSPNVIVAPITNTVSTNSSVFPLTRPASSPLQGNVLLANIKTISKARLGNYIDDLDKTTEIPGVENAMFNALGVAGKFNDLQHKLNSTQSHLDSVKKERNAAQDGLKEIAKSLGLDENSTVEDIKKAIQSKSSTNTETENK